MPWRIMNKTKVAIVRTPVDYSDVETAVKEAVEMCGGVAVLAAAAGKKVLVKPNLVETGNGESGNTTDYRVIGALISLAAEQDCEVTVGDSSGLRWHGATERCLKETGIRDYCEPKGAKVISFDGLEPLRVEIPDGETIKEAYLAPPAIESDLVIDAPKIKTHVLTQTTGGVKNLFGTVPGGIKSVLHATGSTKQKFAALIVDIYSAIQPGLTVMDGVVGLGGMWREQDKIFPGVIIAGIDAVAVDAVAAKILGYDPMTVPILANAHRRGLGKADLKEIEVIGEPIDSVIKNMGAKAKHFSAPAFGSAVSAALLGQESPELIPQSCTGCGHCPKACPAGAVSLKDGRPVFDMDKCIRCFCCIELCPQRALRITRGRIGNLFLKR
jgi:uncharacterized protein (DUF362 family)/Pyruvate/2-oxoacid:ferredoxin oxidoreductase delta subunit